MTGDTDNTFLATPNRRIAPGCVIEFVRSTRHHNAGERYRYTGSHRGVAGRFAGCSVLADRFTAFAPSRIHRWLEEGTVRVVETSASEIGRAAAGPEQASYTTN